MDPAATCAAMASERVLVQRLRRRRDRFRHSGEAFRSRTPWLDVGGTSPQRRTGSLGVRRPPVRRGLAFVTRVGPSRAPRCDERRIRESGPASGEGQCKDANERTGVEQGEGLRRILLAQTAVLVADVKIRKHRPPAPRAASNPRRNSRNNSGAAWDHRSTQSPFGSPSALCPNVSFLEDRLFLSSRNKHCSRSFHCFLRLRIELDSGARGSIVAARSSAYRARPSSPSRL